MPPSMSRRDALRTLAAAGVGYWTATGPAHARRQSPNEKLNIAVIGVGGQGKANLNALAGENIVALCDVDDERAGDAYQRFPQAKKYYDFRRLLEQMDRQIDAVVISTPDHTHFHPAWMAMQMGKHVYLEKPLAHSVWEVRRLTELAAEKKLATQLGVQRHVHDNIHRAVELVQGGAIGAVSEVHCWVGGTRGMPEAPTDTPPVPDHLKWDLWLGPAAERPYHPTYCPYGWRFWWDFGTGETGNWACHILDIPFWALGLKYPTRVDGSGPPPHPETSPKAMTTRLVFPEVTLYWYHTNPAPGAVIERDLPVGGNNTLFIGSEGMLLCGFDRRRLYPEEQFADYPPPEPTIPDSPGFHREWIDACKGGAQATCNFAYSGPLTEAALLGNVAYRARDGFDWDAGDLSTSGNRQAQELIRPPFRSGWEV